MNPSTERPTTKTNCLGNQLFLIADLFRSIFHRLFLKLSSEFHTKLKTAHKYCANQRHFLSFRWQHYYFLPLLPISIVLFCGNFQFHSHSTKLPQNLVIRNCQFCSHFVHSLSFSLVVVVVMSSPFVFRYI